jgi:hypothetical protein
MSVSKFLTSLTAALLAVAESQALDPKDYAVNATVQISDSPPQIKILWPGTDLARQYIIRRKSVSDNSWSAPLATLPGDATGFSDFNIAPGATYEYEIQEDTNIYPYPNGDSADWVSAYTYICAGVNADVVDFRGKVLLVADSSVASALSNEISTFTQDLVGAGWQVRRRDVSRTDSVGSVKDVIRSEYYADPANLRSVVLIGHVPVPYSGLINPDMHPSHLGAWPSDAYYADIDGNWTDSSVTKTDSDYPENDNVPGDGKFDQSDIPSDVELELGRIDFWAMPAFGPRSEIDLLKNYFHKDHNFRHRVFTLERRGIVRDNFGDLDGDAPAVDAWRHYPVFFTGQTREAGPGELFPILNGESYLWAYGCGGGGYQKADGVGSTEDFAAGDPKAAFLMLHGSYFGDWNNEDNFLRAAIATPNYTLASIWTGLPHWYMHHLALGATLGFSTKLTQNNWNNLYKSHRNFSPAQVHIALMGDPTLSIFPVAPPKDMAARVTTGVSLSWNPSDDPVVGYYVYHSDNPLGPFQRLSTTPISGTTFFERSLAPGTHYYMVRAIKLEQTGSGSFYNASQGIIVPVIKDPNAQLPYVSIIADDADAGEEGGNTGSFRVIRSIVDSSPLVVNLSISGSAQNGVDYQTLGSNVTIPGGDNSAWISLSPIPDGTAEGDETVTISIAGGATYLIQSPASATVTIKDQHLNQAPTISTVADQTIDQNSATAPLGFTIADAETAADALMVTASSSDTTLVPQENIVLGGSGASRTIKITPASNKSGSTTITLSVSDGSAAATSKFALTVRAKNQPPTALGQTVQLKEDEAKAIVIAGSDPEGAPLKFQVISGPTLGKLTGTPPNLIYTPNLNVNGADSFTFVANDGLLDSSPATVNLTIAADDDPPSALAQTVTTPENTPIAIILKASDVDSANFKFTITGNPTRGTLSGTPPNITYTPKANINGTDSFTFKVNDGQSDSGNATVTIQVQPRNNSRITAIKIQNDGSVTLQFTGSPSHQFRVDACVDPKTWTPLGTGVSDAVGRGQFTDTNARTFRYRIYKIEWP